MHGSWGVMIFPLMHQHCIIFNGQLLAEHQCNTVADLQNLVRCLSLTLCLYVGCNVAGSESNPLSSHVV